MKRHTAMTPIALAVLATTLAVPAQADPLPYGPATCMNGFVWREARDGDTVCVTPEVRARTLGENANPGANKEPNGGAYGPDTCKAGFVWREAFDGDTICVTPDERSQTLADNAAAPNRLAENPAYPRTLPLIYEVFSPMAGVVAKQVDIGTKSGPLFNVSLPFRYDLQSVGPKVNHLSLRAVADTTQAPFGGVPVIGCRITRDGTVVAELVNTAVAVCDWTGS
jgi:hypothetical protein